MFGQKAKIGHLLSWSKASILFLKKKTTQKFCLRWRKFIPIKEKKKECLTVNVFVNNRFKKCTNAITIITKITQEINIHNAVASNKHLSYADYV